MNAPRKILVVRFSSIGDIILTSPVVRWLKVQLGAEVHFLTKAQYRFVLAHNPHIDRFHTIKSKVSEALPGLRAEGYDLIVDLHKNFRSFQVKMGLGVPSCTFEKLNIEKWLLVNFKINRLPAGTHLVDRYAEGLARLGIVNDGQGLDFFIPADSEVEAAAFLRANSGAGAIPDPHFVAYVVASTSGTRTMPFDKAVTICRGIQRPVILFGGAGEAKAGAFIAAEAGAHVINACGMLTFYQSAALIRQSAMVVTPDTSLMHVAAAYHRPVCLLWGSNVYEFGMFPYYPRGMNKMTGFGVDGLACRPCSKIGFDQCPKGHFRCMRDISEAEILQTINEEGNR